MIGTVGIYSCTMAQVRNLLHAGVPKSLTHLQVIGHFVSKTNSMLNTGR